ncbi:MAG: LysR family transcriptional regulator, partial [Gemmataceae bacterium]
VAEVIEQMQQCLDGFEPVGPEEVLAATDPRSVLSQTIGYWQNNRSRMDYPSYRRSGLPVTSSCVESLIKEFNFRVKGTENFWNRPNGVESMLQIRAALLSEEDTLAEHMANRPGSYFRRYEKKQTTMAA